MCCEKYLKDNKQNSFYLQKRSDICPLILSRHFLKLIDSVPRGTLSENRSLLETGNFQGEISEGVFAPNLSLAHTKEIIINSKGTRIVKDEKH